MSALTLLVIQLGILAMLWIFVLVAVSVMRSDLFGVRVPRESVARAPRQAREPRAAKPPRPAKQGRAGRGTPTTLMVVEGNLAGTKLGLDGPPITAGRHEANTLVLEDDYVSGRHARFFAEDGRWFVEDLGSTNGTLVGEGRITIPTALAVGARVRMGKTVIEVRK